jgi:hypothetical protein
MPTLSDLSRIYIVGTAGELHKDLLSHSLSCVRKEQVKMALYHLGRGYLWREKPRAIIIWTSDFFSES